jgi:inhibitor of cysteine peptidase
MMSKHAHASWFRGRRALIWMAMLGICLLALASCGKQTITLTKDDNGKTIQSHVGDTVVVQLDENATTGYKWSAVKTPDASILALQNSTYTPAGNVPGQGGQRQITFLAKSSGTVQLQFKYWRSFVGDSSIIGRYSVIVEVQS